MRRMKKKILSVGLLALILVAGGVWYMQNQAPQVFALDSRDTVSTWNFQGSHKDGGELEQRVNDEIGRLEERLRDAEIEPPDYQLHVGIAGQYTLLGDGERTYDELQKALAIDSETTGLAWHNMGVLMERLGALNSAHDAYQRAVAAQPHIDAYHMALVNFVLSHFSEDKQIVVDTLSQMEAQFDNDMFVYQARASWLVSQGQYEDAIRVWEQFKSISPVDMHEGVDAEIAKLRSKI